MSYYVEISLKKSFRDRHGEHLRADIADMGLKNVPRVRYCPVYALEGDVTLEEVRKMASALLVDPVVEDFAVHDERAESALAKKNRGSTLEVWLRPGVTDTVAESVVKAVRDLGIAKPLKVKTGRKFNFEGKVLPGTLRRIAERLLVNPMIQEYRVQEK